MVRIYTACGGEGSNCASMAIKISDVCLGSHCWLICLVCSLNSCCIYPPPGAKMLSKFKFLKILWLFCAWRGKHWYFGGRAALLSWLLPEFSNRDMSWLDCIHEQICSLSIASFQKISKNFFNKILDWEVVVTEIFSCFVENMNMNMNMKLVMRGTCIDSWIHGFYFIVKRCGLPLP